MDARRESEWVSSSLVWVCKVGSSPNPIVIKGKWTGKIS